LFAVGVQLLLKVVLGRGHHSDDLELEDAHLADAIPPCGKTTDVVFPVPEPLPVALVPLSEAAAKGEVVSQPAPRESSYRFPLETRRGTAACPSLGTPSGNRANMVPREGDDQTAGRRGNVIAGRPNGLTAGSTFSRRTTGPGMANVTVRRTEARNITTSRLGCRRPERLEVVEAPVVRMPLAPPTRRAPRDPFPQRRTTEFQRLLSPWVRQPPLPVKGRERAMHARVSTYSGWAAQVDDGVRNFEGTTDALLDGFEGAYLLVDRRGGRVMTITMWSTEQAVEASAERAGQIRQKAAGSAGLSIDSVGTYEVALQIEPPT
jgi:heme-degrading monooxygenase HmoA